MRRVLPWLCSLALAVLLTDPAAAADISQAQPKLPTLTLVVGSKKVTAEIADSEQERSAGLMFRESLGEDEGMLFVMDEPGPAGFWMQNTKIPLSIAYINAVGVILEIHDLQPLDETIVPSRFTTVAYALEMPQGWFLKNGVIPGDTISGLPPVGEE